ncbi:MAG: histidine kinase [Bacteroidales bacterium]
MSTRRHKRTLFHHLLDLLLVILIGDVITFFFHSSWSSFIQYILWNSLYSLVIGGFLWKGNELLGWIIGRKIDKKKYPFKALRWNLIGMFIYSSIAILGVNYVWWVLLFGRQASFLLGQGLLIMIIEFVVTILITSILFSISFFKAWRESAVNEERLKKESMAFQYRALKNQVNPHFLFNSLNTLSSLVYKDQDVAAKFIKQLSEVYRYVLEHEESEVVEVKTEMDFVQKYLYLQQIRLGDHLKIKIDISDCNDKLLIPASVQMLVENSIKHNIVSKEEPLEISILNNSEYIIVKNNLQKKSSLDDTGGIGLENLKTRYAFLTDEPVVIEESSEYFVVKLPFIQYKSI